jgi:nucleoside-diphosphate-sugar epimerase
MRVFVSGATGVVGKRAVPLLVAQGHSVTALIRNPAGSKRPELAGAAGAVGDLFDLASLTRAIAGHDAIVNLATHMPASSFKMLFRSSWRENDRIRTEGVANLVDAALICGVPTFVQESFAPTYPDRGDEWIDERTALAPSDYNKTVLDAERSIARFRDAKGRGVILRFAAFYGPDAMQMKTIIEALRKGWAALPGVPADSFHRFRTMTRRPRSWPPWMLHPEPTTSSMTNRCVARFISVRSRNSSV